MVYAKLILMKNFFKNPCSNSILMPKHTYEMINKSWHNLTLYTVNNIAILHRGFMCRIALRKHCSIKVRRGK